MGEAFLSVFIQVLKKRLPLEEYVRDFIRGVGYCGIQVGWGYVRDFSHSAGTMPFAVIGEEFRERTQTSPDRGTMFELTHTTPQDCQTWPHDASLIYWQGFQQELSKQPQDRQNTQEGRNDAFNKVFGKRDSRGRVFGAGCGVRPGDIPGTSSSRQSGRRYAQEERMRELEAQNEQRQREFEARCQRMDATQSGWEETRQQLELQHKQLEAQQKLIDDLQREREIERNHWMEEGARRHDEQLRQQVRHIMPTSLETPAAFYDYSEYRRAPLLGPTSVEQSQPMPHAASQQYFSQQIPLPAFRPHPRENEWRQPLMTTRAPEGAHVYHASEQRRSTTMVRPQGAFMDLLTKNPPTCDLGDAHSRYRDTTNDDSSDSRD